MVLFCTECGAKQDVAEAKFCRECGQAIKKPSTPSLKSASLSTPLSSNSSSNNNNNSNNIKRGSASSLTPFVTLNSNGAVLKRVSSVEQTNTGKSSVSNFSASPTQVTCETCACTNFKPDAFRNTKCVNCFHIHNQKPAPTTTTILSSSSLSASTTPTSTTFTTVIPPAISITATPPSSVSSPVLTHVLVPKPKTPGQSARRFSLDRQKSATAPSSSYSTNNNSGINSNSSSSSAGRASRRCTAPGCSRWVFENGKCKLHFGGNLSPPAEHSSCSSCNSSGSGGGGGGGNFLESSPTESRGSTSGSKTKTKLSEMMESMKKSASQSSLKMGGLFKKSADDGKEGKEDSDSTNEPKGHVKYENMVDAEDVIPFLALGFRTVLCAPNNNSPLPPQPIDDYRAKHMHALEMNEKEFNFLDYAPGFFCSFRRLFGITDDLYIRSLILEGINGGKLGAGKSGMLFFFSNDKRFVVKTLTREEVAFFRQILPHYDKFVRGSLHTLIPRFFGMYKITMPDKKLRVIVMNNLFDCPGLKLSEKYDLKGSTRNRYVDIEKDPEAAKGVLKDMNFTDKKIFFGPAQKEVVMNQLRIDTEFLMEMNIMDQSLLLGIHQEPDTSNDASRYNPLPSTLPAKLGKMKGRDDRPDLYNVFQTQGGVRGWDAATNRPTNVVYVFGVIDILQMFNAHKRLESAYKSARYGKSEISAIDSKSYGQRFLEYMDAHTV